MHIFRKHIVVLLLTCVAVPFFAQNTGKLPDYRRNALATMLVFHPEDTFGIYIYDAFDSLPLPDKYDDHNIGERMIDNSTIHGVRNKKVGLNKAEYGKVLSESDIQANATYLEALLNENEVGKKLVAKWWGLTGDSVTNATFSTELIQERGQYNASEVDIAIANQTLRGVAALSDAGEELIGQTFVLINDITYVTAEQEAAAAKASFNVIGGIFDALFGGNSGAQIAKDIGDIADSFTGFNVKTHSYLFRLIWNDSIANVFYKQYTATPNPEKIQAFLDDHTSYKVRYVAHEYEYDKKSTLKGQYERSELVKTICARSMDKNIVALAKQYEDFKVKTPIFDVLYDGNKIAGYTASIGLKEGVKEDTKYQVVQRKYNPDTGVTGYKYVATVKPKKGAIWDNRYNAVKEQGEGSGLHYTTFQKVGGGEILPGMLLIEGKYKKVTE